MRSFGCILLPMPENKKCLQAFPLWLIFVPAATAKSILFLPCSICVLPSENIQQALRGLAAIVAMFWGEENKKNPPILN